RWRTLRWCISDATPRADEHWNVASPPDLELLARILHRRKRRYDSEGSRVDDVTAVPDEEITAVAAQLKPAVTCTVVRARRFVARHGPGEWHVRDLNRCPRRNTTYVEAMDIAV